MTSDDGYASSLLLRNDIDGPLHPLDHDEVQFMFTLGQHELEFCDVILPEEGSQA